MTINLPDDTTFGILDERADVFYLLGIRIFGTSLSDAVFQHALCIDDAVGIVDGLDGLVGESATAQANQVHASIADRLLAGNDVGRNVLTGASATLEHDVAAHVQELVEQAGGRDDGVVIDDHLAGKLR